MGATPIDSIAGNEINEPPPAIAFITPAIKEATTSQMYGQCVVNIEIIHFLL
jgi:hypothetical protein